VLNRQQVRDLQQRIASQSPPVLSFYLNVNSARPENNPRANALRAKETLKALNVPAELVQEVTSLVGGVPPARTVAVFGRPGALELVPLQVDLPVIDGTNGRADAHWGEPYLSPLELALDEFERYGVVYVDSERLRLFQVFLGEIEEMQNAFRASPPGAEDRMRHAKRTHPAYVASRDQAGKDNIARRMDEWTHRFYKHATIELDSLVREHGIDRLILLGPDENVRYFENALPKALRERVVACEPSLSSPDAPPTEVLARIADVIGRVEAQRERRLLDQIRERGTWGVERCLQELQQGRLQVVAVPWNLQAEAWVVSEIDYVTTDEARARSQANGHRVEQRPLLAILPELAAAYGARVEFLRGQNAERVQAELGGLAGLLRW
jgi:peptide subunit release factor 1 (eRF1)